MSSYLSQHFMFFLGVLCLILITLLIVYVRFFRRPSRKAGFGAGENNRWNRNIRTDRPSHESKHYKLEHVWRYEGMKSKVRTDHLSMYSARLFQTPALRCSSSFDDYVPIQALMGCHYLPHMFILPTILTKTLSPQPF